MSSTHRFEGSDRESRAGANEESVAPSAVNRRDFLESLGRAAALTTIAGGLSLAPSVAGVGRDAEAGESGGPISAKKRRARAYKLRVQAAKRNLKQPVVKPIDNGDEDLLPGRVGNFCKGLPHDANGDVDPAAYAQLLHAVSTGKQADFEAITMGCPTPANQRKFVNPLSGLAFETEGLDVCQFELGPPPGFSSAEAAAEMVELYWMALLRDVHFEDYATDVGAAQAVAELNTMTDFRGPKVGGVVTPGTLFRDILPGTLAGPWLSQFLMKGVPFGATHVDQMMRTVMPGDDHVTDFATWLDIQRGCQPVVPQNFDTTRRYIRNGRDIGQWVHIDVLFQAYFHAALILFAQPDGGDLVTGGGIGCPLNPGNPYLALTKQEGFGTFGPKSIFALLAEVSTRALKAVWFKKWYMHRRVRPEAFGGHVHQVLANAATHPIHADLLNSTAVATTFTAKGSYLLPQAFPEGSPMHPSYGSGHATVAGACVTILKAMFDESFLVPNPVVVSPDGLSLLPYGGPDAGALTVGGELNKVASNIATARNIAGVHYRTDAIDSIHLGEQVAISVLRDQREMYREEFDGFTFTDFDGETVTV